MECRYLLLTIYMPGSNVVIILINSLILLLASLCHRIICVCVCVRACVRAYVCIIRTYVHVIQVPMYLCVHMYI